MKYLKVIRYRDRDKYLAYKNKRRKITENMYALLVVFI